MEGLEAMFGRGKVLLIFALLVAAPAAAAAQAADTSTARPLNRSYQPLRS
jgi:hypothetical protein